MKLYKTAINQISNFSTKLKGDTLLGQLCWMIVFKYGENRLKELLNSYEKTPFLIVSDPFATGYFPKPKMPSRYLNENIDQKKENRKKIWLTFNDLKNGNYQNAKKDSDIKNENIECNNMHNSINYKTFHTDGDEFAPYTLKEYKFLPKDIYFLTDENLFSKSELTEILTLLSEYGYGKDTTIGKGRFLFSSLQEQRFEFNSTTFMALSPFSPQGMTVEKIFYEPFVRFGKMGADRAYTNPFKKPLLLADSGSVVKFHNIPKKHYIGKAIKNITQTYNDTVHQGYSIIIPIKEIS